jgi:hypothetical protein
VLMEMNLVASCKVISNLVYLSVVVLIKVWFVWMLIHVFVAKKNFILLFYACMYVGVHVCICANNVYMLNLKGKLAYFRIKELKDILSLLGLSKQGKKQVSVLLFLSLFFYCNCLCKDLQVLLIFNLFVGSIIIQGPSFSFI